MLRGNRNFMQVSDYESFLKKIEHIRNQGREQKLSEEYKFMKPLPEYRWNAPKIVSARVSPSSTVTVMKGVYSVPSRLISLLLYAHVYAIEVVLYYGDKEVQRMTRLPKEGGAAINYRHIIGHLLRKPGAFQYYQYHDSLFPRVIFRKAYDFLLKTNLTRGSKIYLEILNYAAITNEQDVAVALEHLIDSKILSSLETVRKFINQPKNPLPSVQIYHPNLAQYDQLIRNEEVNVITH
jgi:hypothetical protein